MKKENVPLCIQIRFREQVESGALGLESGQTSSRNMPTHLRSNRHSERPIRLHSHTWAVGGQTSNLGKQGVGIVTQVPGSSGDTNLSTNRTTNRSFVDTSTRVPGEGGSLFVSVTGYSNAFAFTVPAEVGDCAAYMIRNEPDSSDI